MDNRKLILAVAGSGKTYYIVQQLNEQSRFLLFTYTISGTENLIKEVVARFGYLPPNVKIYNYFSFLYSFCYRPFLADELNDKGIFWKQPKSFFNQSYLTASQYLYHNKLSKLICEKAIDNARKRITKYFDVLLIDEVQDFGGNDFNFLIELLSLPIKTLLVGDFYQHTFDTSRDRQTNKSLHHNFRHYVARFEKAGVTLDSKTLVKSRRCSETTCDFIRHKLGVNIESAIPNKTICKLITDKVEAEQIFKDNQVVKLFYQKHYEYNCSSDNWGACKGLTFENVCVVINDEILKMFNQEGSFNFNSNITKNKFYVACSRSKNHLYFIHDKLIKKINVMISAQ